MGEVFAVSYGAGINSTAMLIGMRDRGLRPDLITFADTGAELPETYEFLHRFAATWETWNFPALVIVRTLYQGKFEGLEGQCLRRQELPGLAYGTRSCSTKYKGDPQDNYLKKWAKKNGVDLPIRKAIGYDAGEGHRANKKSSKPEIFTAWYPLVEWGWRRQECLKILASEGICDVPKSKCVFCPAFKKWEVVKLSRSHPEQYARGIAIERAAQATTKRGLGALWKWEDVVKADEDQVRLWERTEQDNVNMECGCM